MNNCELCSFYNPKATVTAVIIKDGKLLVLKRNEEPFKDQWDLPGGYMRANETPEQAIKRELKEELTVDAKVTFIKSFPGSAFWKGEQFPVLNNAFLVEINQEINLNKENSEYYWADFKNLYEVAFDSNMDILNYVKNNFDFDLERIKKLVQQLDSSASVNEHSLYEAVLQGYISKAFNDDGILIGIGWAFPRQTMLRKQAVIEDMIVDENQRGKGLGYRILDDVIKQALADGVEVIELTTNPKREAANKLYQRYGFNLHITNHYLYQKPE